MATRTLILALLAATCLAGGTHDAEAARGDAAASSHSAEQLVGIDRQADAAYREGRDADAERLYTELARALPDEAPYWFRLGNVYARSGRDEEAVLAYRKALQRQPGHARAMHNLAVVRLRQAQDAYDASARAAAPGDGVYEESRRMQAALREAKPREDARAPAAETPKQPAQQQAGATQAAVPAAPATATHVDIASEAATVATAAAAAGE